MRYISTRGGIAPIGFIDTVLMGLADDGGLIIPESIPNITHRLPEWSALSYQDLAFEIMSLFADDLPRECLRKIIQESYRVFPDEVTPVVDVGLHHILELWHGPTLAFKDVALQFLGNLFQYILESRNQNLNILGATSGDTGSAAIYGVRGKKRMNIFIMHPKGRVSPVQERQMTAVLDDNVFNIAVEGSFDDCQNIMKFLSCDLAVKKELKLGAVNSVNWARVLAQVVYYFKAAFAVMKSTGKTQVQFSVPTGNFGDIFAGFIAARMGLPIVRLLLATNENDILFRYFTKGDYSTARVVPTISPSMDIQVASNFERYLYYCMDEDSAQLRKGMNAFAKTQKLELRMREQSGNDQLIIACRCGRSETINTIKRYYYEFNYLLDPHTAIGVYAADQKVDNEIPSICLATAHPAKFNEAIQEATNKIELATHPAIKALADLETRLITLPNCNSSILNYMRICLK